MRITHVVATTALVVLAVTGCNADSENAATGPAHAASDGSSATTPSATTSAATKSGVTKSGGHVGHFGVVKWFNESKGFGSIIDDATGHELYVHVSRIHESTLTEGQRVTYDITTGKKGRDAVNVEVVE